jgi:hypothetical protein
MPSKNTLEIRGRKMIETARDWDGRTEEEGYDDVKRGTIFQYEMCDIWEETHDRLVKKCKLSTKILGCIKLNDPNVKYPTPRKDTCDIQITYQVENQPRDMITVELQGVPTRDGYARIKKSSIQHCIDTNQTMILFKPGINMMHGFSNNRLKEMDAADNYMLTDDFAYKEYPMGDSEYYFYNSRTEKDIQIVFPMPVDDEKWVARAISKYNRFIEIITGQRDE